MTLIKAEDKSEGLLMCKWMDRRFTRNKNVLGVNLGPTGSGKSYRDLRIAELWYKYHFKEQFPAENICFGLGTAMKIIASGKLRKAELIVMEEAGVNLGSRDWSSKFSKMMNYTLQSFRSMQIGILFNLPYLSMLDSQARHLLHYSMESYSIDHEKGLNHAKTFFHQVNQGSGKIYKKYLRVNVGKGSSRVKIMSFNKPSQYLVDAYEAKKSAYLKELTAGFSKALNGEADKAKVRYPSEDKWEAYHMHTKLGLSFVKVGKKQGKPASTVGYHINEVKNWLELSKNQGKRATVEILNNKTPLINTTI